MVHWNRPHVFEQGTRPETPSGTHGMGTPGEAGPSQRRSSFQRSGQPDSPGRQRRKRAAPTGGGGLGAGGESAAETSESATYNSCGQQQSHSKQRRTTLGELHPWIAAALTNNGLEQVRGVADRTCSEREVRLPERLRQKGSALVGKWFVRTKISPSTAAVPKKDFQMKATLDDEGFARMMSLASEYDLFVRGNAADSGNQPTPNQNSHVLTLYPVLSSKRCKCFLPSPSRPGPAICRTNRQAYPLTNSHGHALHHSIQRLVVDEGSGPV